LVQRHCLLGQRRGTDDHFLQFICKGDKNETTLQAQFLRRYCQVDEASTNIGSSSAMMTSATSIDRGDRFPAAIIGGHH